MVKNLDEWLFLAKSFHHKEIDLGLERVTAVAKRLKLETSCTRIVIAGTNGKGSCVAGLEQIYLREGYRVGSFTSPFLMRYNEQVRVQGVPVQDEVLCEAFKYIVQQEASGVRLTLFELGTLAALIIFQEANLDVCLLEVGLGGRFDAVNIVDADLAIVTSIGIDHVEWLGNSREQIAIEKAGVFRPHKPAVCGDLDPPVSLVDYADNNKTSLFCQNKQFGWIENSDSWTWWSLNKQYECLPLSTLALQNMSTVLMGIELLSSKLPVSRQSIEKGLAEVSLPGRIQVIPGDVPIILDVSHNPAAVGLLASFLKREPVVGKKTYAVFSMLMDKDILSTIRMIEACIDFWYVAPLVSERSASVELLTKAFYDAGIDQFSQYPSVKDAYLAAKHQAVAGDRIVVFGSFRTVAEVSAL